VEMSEYRKKLVGVSIYTLERKRFIVISFNLACLTKKFNCSLKLDEEALYPFGSPIYYCLRKMKQLISP
jgi:hypothetical protein